MRLFVVSMLLVFGFPFIMTDVVNSFDTCKESFLKDQPPMIPGILENSVSQDNNRYKLICQKYNNNYKFATLYDITNKIPVFSAYKYTRRTGKLTKRPKWRTEPQLEDSEQADNGDYLNIEMNVDRGHFFPCSHAADQETAKSTFRLTNSVPQYKTFNGGSWSHMEQTVRGIMNSHCSDEKNPGNILAYVLTGAVPNTKTPPDLLNNRVNIPSHMWTVFCCYNIKSNKYVSQAHWAENKDESKEIDVKNLKELQDFLKINYNKESSLFNVDCLTSLKAEVSPPPESEACDDEPDVKKQSQWSTIKNLPAAFWAWLRSFF